LPIVLYGREIWSLKLTEECRLRVFEIRVLRRILGPKRDEVTGEWRKLHKEELYDLHCLPNIILVIKSRRMRWAELVARVEDRRGAYRVLVGRPERKRAVGIPRLKWEDDIEINLQELGWGRGLDYSGSG